MKNSPGLKLVHSAPAPERVREEFSVGSNWGDAVAILRRNPRMVKALKRIERAARAEPLFLVEDEQ